MTAFTRVYSVIVPGAHLMPALLGQRDVNLRIIEQAFPAATIVVRGNEITIDGPQAELVSRLFEELIVLLQGGHHLDEGTLQRSIAMMHDNERPSAVLTDDIMRGAKGKPVRPKSAGQKRYIDAIRNNVITFGLGPAGTGKSWLAVAMAVQALQTKQVQRIILTRPAVEAGERLGFLPGDLMAKIDPYLRPLYDALYDMVEPEGAQRLLERQAVEVAPLAFMRGRTLNSSFIILDEAQNATPEQMKMFLTRIGFGSKVVVTGDTTQVDVPDGRSGSARSRAHAGRHRRSCVRTTRHRRCRSPSHRRRHRRRVWSGPTNARLLVSDDGRPRLARPQRVGGDGVPEVFCADEQADLRVDLARWQQLAFEVLIAEGVRGLAELAVLFVSEREMAELNDSYMGKPGATDVLAFPIDAAEAEIVQHGQPPSRGPTGRRRIRPTCRCCSATW